MNGIFIKKFEPPSYNNLLSRVKKAQKVVDSEVLRYCSPLVPFKTGQLNTSGTTGTHIGSGVVRYTAPYARRQYYKGKKSVTRGRLWFQRMKSQNKKAILAAAQKILEGKT